ncbi:hypothetical protein L1887_01530 [Cichorium endivia]|nr:hypothetical protein L1887_01530 [Cichorium endivia]
MLNDKFSKGDGFAGFLDGGILKKAVSPVSEKFKPNHALLESPTGTGKTLCLLCATLAWRKSLGSFSTGRSAIRSQDTGGKHSEGPSSQSESSRLPTIIYTSRTHSQIHQVVQELKRTIFRCPYYMSRELHRVVDILFAPYNYLIDLGNRKSLSIKWANSILIFDEAHNIEGICADAASFDLPSSLITSCISEAQNCVDLAVTRRDQSNDKSYNPDNFAILKELGFTKPGPYIYELRGELNITHKTATMLIDTIEDATVLLEEDAKTSNAQKTKGIVNRLESIADILKIIFKNDGNPHAKYYR